MKKVHKIVGIILSFAIITLIAGCGGGSSSSPVGVLSVSITDKPLLDENVTAVNIRVIGIEYHHDGNWTEVEDFNATTFNLLDLQNGKSLHLGDFVLPAGKYTQIRFKLAIPEKEEDVKSNPDCNITFKDGSSVPLFVPSGGQSGYKAIGVFNIEADAKVEVTADWDASRSVVVAGDKYILKPVIRLVVNELSGWINGTVVDVAKFDDANDSLVVYAYKDGNYTEAEPEDFLNAVSSGKVNMTDGNFTLAFLGEGLYELVTAHYNNDLVVVVDVEYGIDVDIATGTPVDVNTSD